MIIYNKNKMILNTENISVISIEQENNGYKLVAYHGNGSYIMERSKNPDVLTKDLNNIMCHISTGTKCIDLETIMPYEKEWR